MEISWRENDTIAETFPALRQLSDLDLGSDDLAAVATLCDEELALRWVRLRSGGRTIGDILGVTWSDVLGWRQVGPGRRDGIIRFLAMLSAVTPTIRESVEGKPQERVEGQAVEACEPAPEPSEAITQAHEWQSAVETLASWAATIAGGSTWADLIALASVPRPSDVEAAWTIFAASSLPFGWQSPAREVLADFLECLDERRRLVLIDRVIGPTRRTLEEIGWDLGVSRERVRQIEAATRTAVKRTFEDSEDVRSVRWAVDALRGRLGAIAPVEARSSALPGMTDLLQRLVTWLAGYRYQGGRLLAENFEVPSITGLPRLSSGGRAIDEFETIETLLAAGVKREFMDEVIDSIDGVSRIDGQLVDWTGGQVSRAITVLEVRDRPQDVEELFAFAGGDSLQSFRNRIFESDMVIRVTKNKVGLRSWGGTHYTSITDLMVQRLSSGPMEIRQLADELERAYEVSANSVVMYTNAPVFKVTGDMVALRDRRHPFIPRNKPHAVRGLFRVAPTMLRWHVGIDSEILRGSGHPLPYEIGTFLGLFPGGEPVVLRNMYDDVPVSWPETSITGPNIGSLRVHAEALGGREGDRLCLSFTRGTRRLHVDLLAPWVDGESPASTLSRLTGLSVEDCSNLDALAVAIGVDRERVVEALIKRKDDQVAMAAERVEQSSPHL